MKYLLITLSIICAATIASFFVVLPEQKYNTDDAVVSINGYTLTRKTIQSYKDKDSHHGEENDFLHEIVTKQLLIEEAQHLDIDKQPDFRLALKTFYEHTLIKVLMERVDKEMKVEITDTEIDSFISSFGKTYTFYTLQTSNDVTPEEIMKRGTKHTSLFDDLGESLQLTLAGLDPGDSTMSFVTGNEKFAVFLESSSADTQQIQNIDRDIIHKLLLQAKKENQINNWIESLRRQASITYHEKQE